MKKKATIFLWTKIEATIMLCLIIFFVVYVTILLMTEQNKQEVIFDTVIYKQKK